MLSALHCYCRYCDKYGVELDPKLAQLCSVKPRVPWGKFVNADNQHLASQQVGENSWPMAAACVHPRLSIVPAHRACLCLYLIARPLICWAGCSGMTTMSVPRPQRHWRTTTLNQSGVMQQGMC